MDMELMGESPNLNLNTSLSSGGKAILRKYFNWAIINHLLSSFMAVIISLLCLGVALYFMIDAYMRGTDPPRWADIMISYLTGVWVSGKPKFFSKKKVNKSSD